MNPNILSEIDQQLREQIIKAAETISTSTFAPPTRSVFSPENITPDIKLLVPKTNTRKHLMNLKK
jgi:hypothetical protein